MARRGFSNMKPKTGKNDSLRLEELVELFKFQDHPDEWVQLRFLDSDILPVRRHWVKIMAGKEKKLVTIPRFCVSFNPENEDEPLDAHCPYCDLSTEGGQDATMRNEHFYLVNAIIRDIQEDEPARKAEPTKKEKKTGYKEMKSKSWTPVRVVRLTNSLVARMQELGETNIVKSKKSGEKKAFDVSHPKHGVDVNVKFKPKAAGTDKYSADKVDGRTPLTDEEKEYLVWNLNPELLDAAGRMGEEQAKEDFKRMEVFGGDEVDDDDDGDDLDDDSLDLGSSSKKKKGKKKSGKKASALDDDDDLDDDGDDDDDEPPKKKAKSKKKSKKSKPKRPSFDDDDDDDDEDDDEPPKKKAKSKKKKSSSAKKKAKSAIDDDDDDDDAPPKKKKSKKKTSSSGTKKKGKKKSKPALDDDDDDWDD